MRNDTEHLLSSPVNAERLRQSIKGPFKSIQELWNETTKEPLPEHLKRLVDKLK